MGSRIMHYYISSKLKQELHIEDANSFLVGGLAPDVYESKSGLKEKSHFMKYDEHGLAHPDFNFFKDKYLSRNRTAFNLGYYFHLISDDIWLNEIYYKKIKWLPKDIKAHAKKEYYRDFGRLNGKIIDNYSLELLTLREVQSDIEEIDSTLLSNIISELDADFNMTDSTQREELEILEFSEVMKTLERTVSTCLEYSRMA